MNGVPPLTPQTIAGMVQLVDIVRDAESAWALDGQWHWLLADPVLFERPVPCPGRTFLWTPPADVLAEITGRPESPRPRCERRSPDRPPPR